VKRAASSNARRHPASPVGHGGIPAVLLARWQTFLDELAELLQVPSVLIRAAEASEIVVLVSSLSAGNPYRAGASWRRGRDIYCEAAVQTSDAVHIADAREHPQWKNSPDARAGLIAYLGVNVRWPDGAVLGTICVLDSKPNVFGETERRLLLRFRDLCQLDLESLQSEGNADTRSGQSWCESGTSLQPLAALSHQSMAAREALERSRLHYEQLVSSIDGIVWEADASTFQFTFVSQQAERLLGYPLSRWLDEPNFWREHVHPADREWVTDLCTGATRESRSHDFEYRMIAADGGVVWLRDIVKVVSEHGQPSRLRGIMIDITERKHAEEERRRSEERYRTLIENVNDVVFATDRSGRFTYVSPVIERISGYRVEDLLGKPLIEIVYAEDAAYLEEAARRTMAGQAEPREFRIQEKDGRIRWVRSSSRPRYENGELVGMIGIVTDINDRKRAEEAVQESEARYRQLVELSPYGIVVHARGKVMFANNAAARLMGAADASDLVGRSIMEVVRPERRQQLAERIRTMLETGTPAEAREDQLLRLDGVPIDVETTGMPMIFGGEPAVQVVIHDITERKRTEDALRASEERYRYLVENVNDVVYTMDTLGNFTYVSPAISSVSSYSADEVKSLGVAHFVHPDDLPALEQHRGRNLLGEAGQIDFRVFDKAGDLRWIRASTSPRVENGQVVGLNGIFSDITERKLTENALHESEERYRQLFENAHEIIYCHDLAGNFVSINPAAEVALGYTQTEVESMSLGQIIAPNSRGYVADLIDRVLSKRAIPAAVEVEVITKQGDSVLLEASPRVVERDGVPIAVQGIARDVTERKRAQKEIQRLNEQLEERVRERTAELRAANKELEAFSYSVSHDLRAPLRVIEGFSHVLLEEYGPLVDQQGQYYMSRIQATSTRMGHLIRDLLALARVTRSRMAWTTVDLSAIGHAIAGELANSDAQRDVQFIIENGVCVEGDASLLRVVLENLFENAWKYTSRHERARIEFGTRDADGETIYFVRDDGAGFDMEHASKLFGAFERLHPVSEFEGTGIGLATVQRIVERHGGHVWAEAEPEKGATFYFTLLPTRSASARSKRLEPGS